MSRALKRLGYLNGGLFVGSYGFYSYTYPELKHNPKKVLEVMGRTFRCYSTGAFMLSDYLGAKEINSEVHRKAAQRLFDCFAANSGPYIKLG
jgi:hypothetical protein